MTRFPLGLSLFTAVLAGVAAASAQAPPAAVPNAAAAAAQPAAAPHAAKPTTTDAEGTVLPNGMVQVRFRSLSGGVNPDSVQGICVSGIPSRHLVVVPWNKQWISVEQLAANDRQKLREWFASVFKGASVVNGVWSGTAEFVDYQPLLQLVLLELHESDSYPAPVKLSDGVKHVEQQVFLHKWDGQDHILQGQLTVPYPTDSFPWRIKLADNEQVNSGVAIAGRDGRLIGLLTDLQSIEPRAPLGDATVIIPANYVDAMVQIQDPGVNDELDMLLIGMAMEKERAQVKALRDALPPPVAAPQAGRTSDRPATTPGVQPAGISELALPAPPATELKVFYLKHLESNVAIDVLTSLFDSSATFSSVPSQRTVIANGVPETLKMVEELLSALDAEPQTGEADTGSEAQKTAPVRIGSERPSGEIRLLYLRHLSPGDAVAAIAPLVIGPPVFSGPVGSPTFSGAEVHRVSGPTFVTVPSQRLLIVRGDADALKKVEELIQAIDVPGAATGVAPDSAAKSGRQLAPNSISHVYRFHDSNWLEIVGALQEMRNRAGAEWFEMRSQPDENLLAIGGSAAMLEVVGKTIKRFYPKSELIVKVDNKTVAEIRVFALKHATASDVAKALENVRPEGHVNVSADARTNSVVVTGPPEALQLVERFIALLDVPAKDFKRPLDAERLFAIAQQLRQTGMDVDVVPGFSSPVAQLRTAAAEQAARAQQLANEARKPVAGVKTETQQQALRRAVAEAFDARQQLQQAELAELETRIAAMKRTLAARERIKEQIIDRRVEELLNPALEWDASGAPQPPAGVAGTPPGAAAPTGSPIGLAGAPHLPAGGAGGATQTIRSDWPVPFTATIPSTDGQPAAAPERLYQGRTESDWQRLFEAETEPAAKLDAGMALINLAAPLPADQRIERILDVGEVITKSAYGDAPLEAGFDYAVNPWNHPSNDSVGKAHGAFASELARQLTSIEPEALARGLTAAMLNGSDARAVFAYKGLDQVKVSIGRSDAAKRIVIEALNRPVTGIDRSVLWLLARIEFASVATPEELTQLASHLQGIFEQLAQRPADGDHLGDVLTRRLLLNYTFASSNPLRRLDSPQLSRALAELILRETVNGQRYVPLMRPPLATDERDPYKEQGVQGLRRFCGPALPAFDGVANEYLSQHRSPPFSHSDRGVVGGAMRAISLYSDGDDWPVARTAEILTEQLRSAYTADPAKTVDQPVTELVPALPASMLAAIVAINGRIPEFVKTETPKSAVVMKKLAKLDRFTGNTARFEVDEFESLAGLLGDAPRETLQRLLSSSRFPAHPAPTASLPYYSQLPSLLDHNSVLNAETAVILGSSGGFLPGEEMPTYQQLDPLLLLAILADLAGADKDRDARIASLGSLSLNGTQLNTHIRKLLASPLQSRHHAERMLREMAAKTESQRLLEIIRSIDPALAEKQAAPADPPAAK